MKSILNSDFIFLSAYVGTTLSFPELINPWVVLVGGIIAILVGVANIVKFIHWYKNRNK